MSTGPLTRFDINAARETLRRRNEKFAERLRDRYREATADCADIIDMLKRRYDPRRIWQWGSLLHEEQFSEISDIDIAVEGIGDAETFFRLAGEAREMTRLPLDIIELEKIDTEFRRLITTMGKCAYDREAQS